MTSRTWPKSYISFLIWLNFEGVGRGRSLTLTKEEEGEARELVMEEKLDAQ